MWTDRPTDEIEHTDLHSRGWSSGKKLGLGGKLRTWRLGGFDVSRENDSSRNFRRTIVVSCGRRRRRRRSASRCSARCA